MNKIFIFIILFLSFSSFALADLPQEKFMRNAFRQDILRKWQSAKGILQLREEPGNKQYFQIRVLPEETAKSLKEFYVYGPDGIPPVNSERWSAYISDREKYISQLPLIVSGFGYGDDIPGHIISIPVLDINSDWALICSDWSCDSTGWIKISKPLILFNAIQHVEKYIHVVNFLLLDKAIPIYGRQTKEKILTASETLFQYPDYFPAYWNKFFIKLNFKLMKLQMAKFILSGGTISKVISLLRRLKGFQ